MEKGVDVCEEKVCASCFLVRKEWLYLVLRRLSCFSLGIFQ